MKKTNSVDHGHLKASEVERVIRAARGMELRDLRIIRSAINLEFEKREYRNGRKP